MKKIEVFLLEETLGKIPKEWGVDEFANFRYSDVMKSLYMSDFPDAWKLPQNRNKMCTIGANDYFNKWTGEEFMVIEDTCLRNVFSYANRELVRGSIVNGKCTGIPLTGGNHQLLFYNKKYVDYVPETMGDLIQVAEEAKKRNKLDYGLVFPTGACYFILPFLYGYGADLWSNDNEAISKEAMYKTIKFLKNIIYDMKIAPVKWEQAESIECFKKGKAAYCIGGDWNIKDFDEATNHSLGICAIPKLERECRSTANASYLFVSKYLNEELYKSVEGFCRRFLDEDVQCAVMNQLYRMPAAYDFDISRYELDKKLVSSYAVYKEAFILPAKKDVTHMYHVLADLLEPNILVSDDEEKLTDKVILHLRDVESYYRNNLLKM